MLIVSFDGTNIEVRNDNDKLVASLHSVAEFYNVLSENADPQVMFSSTMDYPEDYTQDQSLIDLVTEVRNS